MKYLHWYDWVGVSLLIAFMIYAVVKTALSFAKGLKSRRILYEKLDDPIELSKAVAVGACVVSKRIELLHGGSPKAPKHNTVFRIVFLTEDGHTLDLEVSEEVFAKLHEQQTGTLVTAEDSFLAFDE